MQALLSEACVGVEDIQEKLSFSWPSDFSSHYKQLRPKDSHMVWTSENSLWVCRFCEADSQIKSFYQNKPRDNLVVVMRDTRKRPATAKVKLHNKLKKAKSTQAIPNLALRRYGYYQTPQLPVQKPKSKCMWVSSVGYKWCLSTARILIWCLICEQCIVLLLNYRSWRGQRTP